MRILHIITSTDLGGAQKVVMDLASCAVKDGHEVFVASMKDGPMWDFLPQEVGRIKLTHMVKPICLKHDFKCFFEVRKMIKSVKPDIIHLHSSKAAVIGRVSCPFRMKKRIVYTVHGFDTIRLRNRVFLPLEKILQKWCGAIVPVSEYDEINLKNENIRHNITLIKNAVADVPPFSESELPAAFKVPYEKARKEGKKIILTIARIALPKRIDIFTEVASLLKEENCAFFWVGSCTDSTLKDELKSCEEKNIACFTGEIPDASRLISYSDVFVLFSNYEGLPITILEALAKAKPVIATDVGGIKELVDDSCGKLVELYENNQIKECSDVSKEIADSLKEMLADEALLKKKAEAARVKYEKDFTLKNMWGKYAVTYQKLIKVIK